MKNKVLTVLFACISLMAVSQDMVLSDPISNRTFDTQKYSGIKGSPFLNEDFVLADVVIGRGIYKNQKIKLDLVNNTVLFSKNDEEFEFTEPVLKFTLMPRPSDTSSYQHFIRGINGGGLKPDQFVQVLAEGPISLYRSDIKLVSETNEVNAGVIKVFNNSTRYFIKDKEGKVQVVKLSEKELLSYLQDKRPALDEYISKNRLNLKREKDAGALIKYYNSL